MRRIFLTTMALAVSLSSMAEQPRSEAVSLGNSDLLGMTSIEDKNRSIMSSYKLYYQHSQQNRLLKQNRAMQQYSQFMKQKSAS